MRRADAFLQVRLDAHLKDAFVEAARGQHSTTSEAMRRLIARFVVETRRADAQRQSKLVATATDAEATMDDAMRAQASVLDA